MSLAAQSAAIRCGDSSGSTFVERYVMRFSTDLKDDELISSRWGTAFIRFIWPVFGWGSIPGVILAALWHQLPGSQLIVAGFAALVLFPAYYWLVAKPLRFVWAGPDGLRVSDGRREVRVPYNQIEHVRGFWYARDLVKVVLKGSTPVGRWFIFIPRLRFSLRGDHPVVNRLRGLAALSSRTETQA